MGGGLLLAVVVVVPHHKAMISAACERFCPIIMITLAAVLGMLPLALGCGIGAELRNGVGIASVGGILVYSSLSLCRFCMICLRGKM